MKFLIAAVAVLMGSSSAIANASPLTFHHIALVPDKTIPADEWVGEQENTGHVGVGAAFAGTIYFDVVGFNLNSDWEPGRARFAETKLGKVAMRYIEAGAILNIATVFTHHKIFLHGLNGVPLSNICGLYYGFTAGAGFGPLNLRYTRARNYKGTTLEYVAPGDENFFNFALGGRETKLFCQNSKNPNWKLKVQTTGAKVSLLDSPSSYR